MDIYVDSNFPYTLWCYKELSCIGLLVQTCETFLRIQISEIVKSQGMYTCDLPDIIQSLPETVVPNPHSYPVPTVSHPCQHMEVYFWFSYGWEMVSQCCFHPHSSLFITVWISSSVICLSFSLFIVALRFCHWVVILFLTDV